jgi:sugar diacid utilization regulator
LELPSFGNKLPDMLDSPDAARAPLDGPGDEFDERVPGWELTRLPRAAVRAAREARLPATLLGPFLEALVEAASSGRRLPAAELDGYRHLGRVAAEQGAALPALVDLYLSAMWRAWPDLPAVSEAGDTPVTVPGLRRAGQSVLRAADDAVAALCAGYSSAQQATARAEAEQRRELVDDLLAGTSDVGGLLVRASEFGLRLESPHVVLVVSGNRPFSEGRPTERRVEAALRDQVRRAVEAGAATDGGLLVTSRLGLLVAVLPAGIQADDLRGLTDRVGAALRREDDLTWRIGVSRPRSGGTGIRASFTEASRAVDLARTLDWPDPVAQAQSLLVYQVLARDADAMRELIAAVLAPMRDARGGAEPLLATLRAYFAAGGVATAAARRLHLSVRALTYRLERIAALTGHDPTDPEDRFTLQAATVGHQLLGWSDQHPTGLDPAGVSTVGLPVTRSAGPADESVPWL